MTRLVVLYLIYSHLPLGHYVPSCSVTVNQIQPSQVCYNYYIYIYIYICIYYVMLRVLYHIYKHRAQGHSPSATLLINVILDEWRYIINICHDEATPVRVYALTTHAQN